MLSKNDERWLINCNCFCTFVKSNSRLPKSNEVISPVGTDIRSWYNNQIQILGKNIMPIERVNYLKVNAVGLIPYEERCQVGVQTKSRLDLVLSDFEKRDLIEKGILGKEIIKQQLRGFLEHKNGFPLPKRFKGDTYLLIESLADFPIDRKELAFFAFVSHSKSTSTAISIPLRNAIWLIAPISSAEEGYRNQVKSIHGKCQSWIKEAGLSKDEVKMLNMRLDDVHPSAVGVIMEEFDIKAAGGVYSKLMRIRRKLLDVI